MKAAYSPEMENKETIIRNFSTVRERIDRALARRQAAGKTVRQVRLLAATKTVPAEEILLAAECAGLSLIGENKVGELLEKFPLLDGKLEQHLIGHLQTNKVRQVVGKVSLIESVDSERLAAEIEKRSAALGIVSDVLLEVNSGREENKGGVFPEDFAQLLAICQSFPHLRVRGVMTMAPVCTEKENYRKYFQETYGLFIDFLGKNTHNIIEPVLSMGMSDSYEIAVEEGATEVRVGSALFGRRSYGTAGGMGGTLPGR